MTIPYEMIVKRIEKGNSLHEQGKNKESLDIYFSVLDDLRNSYENIYDIDETRWLIRCIYNVYFSLKDYISAEKWAKEVFNCKIPYKATSELINLGKVYVELGLENEAMEQFKKLPIKRERLGHFKALIINTYSFTCLIKSKNIFNINRVTYQRR